MQPPALPCRRLFILSLPKNLFSMKKLFGSYLFWTRTLSVLCILLFPVVELLVCGDVSGAVCTLLMSESGGAAMLLATRFSEGRDALCCAVLMFASMACCHFVGAGPGFAVFAAMTLLLLYLMRVFRRRYSRLRPLFRQQAVWLAMQNQFALISCLVLYLLAVLGVLAFSSGWLRVPAVLAMTAFCLHLLFARRGRVYLLGREKEEAIRQMVGGSLAYAPSSSDGDDTEHMRELFAKVVAMMESSQPFLNEDYSLQELAMNLYTNKTTLSRAINLVSGMNFRQFINGYRVRYSVELMKKNPRMRVEELTEMSGFHSTVTYTMAFKANMHVTPGEYLQKLRSNLV